MTDIVELTAGPSAIIITDGIKKEVLVDGKGDLPDKFARCLGGLALAVGGRNHHHPQCTTGRGLRKMARCLWTPRKRPAIASPSHWWLDEVRRCGLPLFCDTLATDTSFQNVGINLAVATMRVGEVARIFVHPKYGYGEKGSFSFPTVPPNADLVYELELLAFENANQEVRAW